MTDLNVVRWRVWYTDGRVFNGTTFNAWKRLPDDGVLSVMLWHADGTRRVMQGDDLYFATAEGVYAHDSRYSAEEIADRYPGASIKRGKWTTDAEMLRVAAEAIEAE